MKYNKRKLGKKGTAWLLSALMIASALPLAVYAEETSAKTTEYVNLRSGPGTSYSSKGVIASGTTLTVTDTGNSEWYAVHFAFRQLCKQRGEKRQNNGVCQLPLRPRYELQLKGHCFFRHEHHRNGYEQLPMVCRAPFERFHRLHIRRVYQL